jgi:hypothetical protein
MLKIKESERATLMEIILSDWVTNDGQEILDPT